MAEASRPATQLCWRAPLWRLRHQRAPPCCNKTGCQPWRNTLQVANCAAGATYREVGREAAATLLLGVVAPLATLAVLEGRARTRFLSLHTHLDDPQVAQLYTWKLAFKQNRQPAAVEARSFAVAEGHGVTASTMLLRRLAWQPQRHLPSICGSAHRQGCWP